MDNNIILNSIEDIVLSLWKHKAVHKRTYIKVAFYIEKNGKSSFAYAKLIQILINSVLAPDEYMIMGGTYETPVLCGLLDQNFVENLRLQGTFNEEAFNRQYKQICTNKILRIAGISLELFKLQHKYETRLNVNV